MVLLPTVDLSPVAYFPDLLLIPLDEEGHQVAGHRSPVVWQDLAALLMNKTVPVLVQLHPAVVITRVLRPALEQAQNHPEAQIVEQLFDSFGLDACQVGQREEEVWPDPKVASHFRVRIWGSVVGIPVPRRHCRGVMFEDGSEPCCFPLKSGLAIG